MAGPSRRTAPAEWLLEEYRANVELWKHDDTLRQQRTGNFLLINSILLVTFSGIVAVDPAATVVGIVAIVMAVFGATLSVVWRNIQARNAEYVRFRRFQLRSIEAQLPGLTTFENTYSAFYEDRPVDFAGIDDVFVLRRNARVASTLAEAQLPIIVGCAWLAMFVSGVVVLVVAE